MKRFLIYHSSSTEILLCTYERKVEKNPTLLYTQVACNSSSTHVCQSISYFFFFRCLTLKSYMETGFLLRGYLKALTRHFSYTTPLHVIDVDDADDASCLAEWCMTQQQIWENQ